MGRVVSIFYPYLCFYFFFFEESVFFWVRGEREVEAKKSPLTPITLPPIKIIQLTLVKKPP